MVKLDPWILGSLLIIGGSGCPAIAIAATDYDRLQRDSLQFEKVLTDDSEDTSQESAYQQAHSGAELFPALEEEDAGEQGEFITFEWNGQILEFIDVPRTEWFAPYVRDVSERGIASGYSDQNGVPVGRFGPANNVTVAELAKMALVASHVDVSTCARMPLNMTASGSWAAPFVSCAESKGWSIYSDGSVDTARPATREEVVVTILEAFTVIVRGSTGEAVFTDVDSSVLFRGAIETAAKDGLVSGYADEAGVPTGLFGPRDPVKRAEIAKIVSLALLIYAQE